MVGLVNIADKIGSLPDLPNEVTRQILSHLPTNVALRTCILSKGLMRMFPFSNNLDLDDSLLLNPQINGKLPSGQTSHFMDFVDRCITLMNATQVDKFRLKCAHDIDTSCVNSWVCAAPLCNVRELDLCILSRDFKMKPLCVFTCSTLVILKLGSDFALFVPDRIDLPCLKSLHLDSVEFPNDESSERLFSSCPLLEELSLVGCNMVNIRHLNVISPTLKRLTIERTISKFFSWDLSLDTPNLVYLKYDTCNRDGYELKNLHSISEAHISIAAQSEFRFRTEIPQLLQGINTVQSLYLSGHFGEFHVFRLEDEPLFEYLTRLALTCQPFLNLCIVMKLLKFTPNIEELSFDGNLRGVFKGKKPSCLSYRLKAIECRMVYDDVKTMQRNVESLECLLKVANVLKKVSIRICCEHMDREAGKKLGKMMEPIKKLGQSKGCEIKFFRE